MGAEERLLEEEDKVLLEEDLIDDEEDEGERDDALPSTTVKDPTLALS